MTASIPHGASPKWGQKSSFMPWSYILPFSQHTPLVPLFDIGETYTFAMTVIIAMVATMTTAVMVQAILILSLSTDNHFFLILTPNSYPIILIQQLHTILAHLLSWWNMIVWSTTLQKHCYNLPSPPVTRIQICMTVSMHVIAIVPVIAVGHALATTCSHIIRTYYNSFWTYFLFLFGILLSLYIIFKIFWPMFLLPWESVIDRHCYNSFKGFDDPYEYQN